MLVLVDEIMDYLRVAAASNPDGAVLDVAFLRALLDVVNVATNCVVVVSMINSDQDNMATNDLGTRLRGELEDLLNRNAATSDVTSGGDFAEIVRRRLFVSPPPADTPRQVADSHISSMTPRWRKVFEKLNGFGESGFRRQVERTYPFHPSLMRLAEDEWSTQPGVSESAVRYQGVCLGGL